MQKKSQKFLWIFLALAIFLGLIWQFYPLPTAEMRMHSLPLKGPGFLGYELPLTEFEKNYFKGVNLIKRFYDIDRQFFFITVLDGTYNRHIVHDPYYCFKGSGWDVLNERPYAIPGGEAKLLHITKDNQKKEALYWFSNEKEHYTSPFHYWLEATCRRLTLGLSGAEPILIIVQPVNSDTANWKELENKFHYLFNL